MNARNEPRRYKNVFLIFCIAFNKNLKIPKLPINCNSLYEDSWFSGFIDADGNFYIRFSNKQIGCRFTLEQRMICPISNLSYEELFNKIKEEFKCNLYIKYLKNYYIIKIENQTNNKLLINYLNKYPLYSSKYLDYLNYSKAFYNILNKYHLNSNGKNYIYNLKINMNDKRTIFDWKHLNNL